MSFEEKKKKNKDYYETNEEHITNFPKTLFSALFYTSCILFYFIETKVFFMNRNKFMLI